MPDENLETEAVKRYFELSATRDAVAAKAQASTELTRGIFEEAVAATDQQLAAFDEDPEVRAYMVAAAGDLFAIADKLNELEQAAQQGVIKDELLVPLRTAFENRLKDPRLEVARRFVIKTGLIDQALEVAPVTAEPAPVVVPPVAAPEPVLLPEPEAGEKIKPQVKIIVRGHTIQMGERGQIIKLDQGGNTAKVNYADLRLKMLKTLVAHKGEMVVNQDLWQEAFGEELPYNSRVMYRLGEWFPSVTYRNAPLIQRGKGSNANIVTYGIMGHEVSLEERAAPEKTPVVATPVPAPEPIKEAIKEVVEEPQAEPTPVEAIETKEPVATVSLEVGEFPFNTVECSLLAEFICSNNEVLAQGGIEPISKEVPSRLAEVLDDDECAAIMANYGGTEQARASILNKARAFFTNDDLVLEALDKISVQDDRYPVFEYIASLNGDDRWSILEELVTAEHGVAYVAEINRGHVEVVGTRHAIYTAQGGHQVDLLAGSGIVRSLSPQVEAEEAIDLDAIVEGSDSLLQALKITQAIVEPQVEPLAQEPVPDDVVEELEPTVDLVEGDVMYDVINTAVAYKGIDNFVRAYKHQVRTILTRVNDFGLLGARREAVRAGIFPWLESSVVKNAAENGHLTRGTEEFSLSDLLHLHASHVYRKEWSVTSKTQRVPSRKLIKSIIKAEVRSFEEELAKAKAHHA